MHVCDIMKPKKKSKTLVMFLAAPPSAYINPATCDDVDLSSVDLGDMVTASQLYFYSVILVVSSQVMENMMKM